MVRSRSYEIIPGVFEDDSWTGAQAVNVVELVDADETVRLILIIRLFRDWSECSGDMDGQVGNFWLF